MESDDRLTGRHRVAVLDEPLDDGAAVRSGDREVVPQALDVADDRARRKEAPAGWSGARLKTPFIGATSNRQVGLPSSGPPSPCFSTNARASSSWSGVFSANVSTPGIARRAIPVSVPAGGISSMPVTPRSCIVRMQRSQRTGELTWVTMRSSTSRPLWTMCPSRFESSRVRGSCVLIARAYPPSRSTACST